MQMSREDVLEVARQAFMEVPSLSVDHAERIVKVLRATNLFAYGTFTTPEGVDCPLCLAGIANGEAFGGYDRPYFQWALAFDRTLSQRRHDLLVGGLAHPDEVDYQTVEVIG